MFNNKEIKKIKADLELLRDATKYRSSVIQDGPWTYYPFLEIDVVRTEPSSIPSEVVAKKKERKVKRA